MEGILKTVLIPALAAAAVMLSGCVIIATGGGERSVVIQDRVPGVGTHQSLYRTAVADPRRPVAEVERDPLRYPVEMLAFTRLRPGHRIADIRPEEGYFTRLFAPVVGPQGRVYAFVPTRTAERENGFADALATEYGNVERVTGALDSMRFPEPLDAVFMAQEYHDFHIPGFNTDVAAMNRAVFAALKPGGVYVVIDHEAAPGTGISAVQTLHRIEGAQLRREVEAAGFVFDGESDALRNPDDDHSINVFREPIRGRTDQFAYRFRKPG
jgi:predicted methyltransferase